VLAQSLESPALIADSGGPIRPPDESPALSPAFVLVPTPFYLCHTLINETNHYVVVRNFVRKSCGRQSW
jgi:hypothetical protein